MQVSLSRIIVTLTVLSLSAAAAPNFSGRWKLDPEKSKLSGDYAGLQEERTIEHKEPELKVNIHAVQDGEEAETSARYTTDSKEIHNSVDGYTLTSVVTWNGGTLVFESTLIEDTDTVEMRDRWTLSEDGNHLTIERKQKLENTEQESVFVYNKM